MYIKFFTLAIMFWSSVIVEAPLSDFEDAECTTWGYFATGTVEAEGWVYCS
ncbi:MAG: hypothetical protein IPK94_08350 [Saprospiraceae bacterium]|nr:hypothetical protein [Saprospiraceae bacterium]